MGSRLRTTSSSPAANSSRLPRFRVQGSGFRVQGLGCRVQGLGFRVQGLGFWVLGLGGNLGLAARKAQESQLKLEPQPLTSTHREPYHNCHNTLQESSHPTPITPNPKPQTPQALNPKPFGGSIKRKADQRPNPGASRNQALEEVKWLSGDL